MDAEYMGRALELAKMGTGYTNPNPLVGAVIVKGGRIIGEGYHQLYGSHHAEVNAFKNATEDVRGATMYITLEPCSHYGKTPPCADAIVEKGIKKAVIGMTDPNPLVAGRGIRILQNNGIEVVTGVMEKEARKINEIFVKYITTKLPFCIMKTAMTLDGKTAAYTGDSKWVTGELSREYVHKLRHQVAGIMVGIGTILADDPLLTARIKGIQASDPVRIIVDSSARVPLEAKILNVQSNAGTIIAVTDRADKGKIRALEEKKAEVIVCKSNNESVDLLFLMKVLGERKIDSVLLEGGSELNFSALKEGIVDKVNVFIAPKIIGGSSSKTPVGGAGIKCMNKAIALEDIEVRRYGNDIMVEGYTRKGD